MSRKAAEGFYGAVFGEDAWCGDVEEEVARRVDKYHLSVKNFPDDLVSGQDACEEAPTITICLLAAISRGAIEIIATADVAQGFRRPY
jgi:hypothetical protein